MNITPELDGTLNIGGTVLTELFQYFFRVQCPGKVRIRIHFQLVRTYGHIEHIFPGITSRAKRGCL